MNTEQPDGEKPNIETPEDAQKAEQRARQPRLRELLAIPERDRSDAVWDEIIELEISLAPGNRASGSQGDGGRHHDSGRGPQQPGGGRPGRGSFKKSRRRRGG
jgi:hypothetical protein